MAHLRRLAAAVLCAAVSLTACTSHIATDAIETEINGVAKAVEHQTGTPEELAKAVTRTSRGDRMALEVLSAKALDAADEPTTRLVVALHFDGYPDGFGDVPSRTRCYRMDFTADGLAEPPKPVGCDRDPWEND